MEQGQPPELPRMWESWHGLRLMEVLEGWTKVDTPSLFGGGDSQTQGKWWVPGTFDLEPGTVRSFGQSLHWRALPRVGCEGEGCRGFVES